MLLWGGCRVKGVDGGKTTTKGISIILATRKILFKKKDNVTLLKSQQGSIYILHVTIQGTLFLGVFLKRAKSLCVFLVTTSLVSTPCLCPNWYSDRSSDDCRTLNPGKFSSTSIELSPKMASLGWRLSPSLLAGWELQVWYFPLCVSHSPKAQNTPKQR